MGDVEGGGGVRSREVSGKTGWTHWDLDIV